MDADEYLACVKEMVELLSWCELSIKIPLHPVEVLRIDMNSLMTGLA